eukprot:967353_1
MATVVVFVLLLSLVFISSIHAASITINNPGFESDDPNCPPNTYWYYQNRWVTGWAAYDPINAFSNPSTVGIANPRTGDFFSDPINGSGAPEGNAIVYIAPQIGSHGNGPCGIEQTLSDPLAPNTEYTLTAKVGNPGANCYVDSTDGPQCYDRIGSPGYSMQLLAGNVILAQDDNSINVDDYTWAITIVQFTTTSSHSQLGTPLKIRLLNKNDQYSSDWILFLDDVVTGVKKIFFMVMTSIFIYLTVNRAS